MTNEFDREAWRLNPAERWANPTPETTALLALPPEIWQARIVGLAKRLERELAVVADIAAYWEAEARKRGAKGPGDGAH